MWRRCCSNALRFFLDEHVLLPPEDGEDSEDPPAGEPMALGRVAGAAMDEDAGAAADAEAGAAIDAGADAMIDAEAGATIEAEAGAATDVDACTALEVLTLRTCPLDTE